MILARRLITVSAAILAAAILAAACAAASAATVRIERAEAETRMADARHVLDLIDRFISDRRTNIKVMASGPGIQTIIHSSDAVGQTDAAALDRANHRMEDLLVDTGPWLDLVVADKDGRVVYETGRSAAPWTVFSVATDATVFRAALAGGVADSDADYDERLGAETMAFAAPIREPGHPEIILGAVIGHLAWPVMHDLVENVGGAAMTLYDSSGRPIADGTQSTEVRLSRAADQNWEPVRRAINGESGIWTESGAGRRREVVYATERGYMDFPGHGWFLMRDSSLPATAWSETFTTSDLLILLLIAIAGMAGLTLALSLSLSPLGRLAEQCRAYVASLGAIEHGEAAVGELAVLERAFLALAGKLHDTEELAERHLADCTAELKAHTEELESNFAALKRAAGLRKSSTVRPDEPPSAAPARRRKPARPAARPVRQPKNPRTR